MTRALGEHESDGSLVALAQGQSLRWPAALRHAATAVGFAALVASFVVGSDLFGSRESLFGTAALPLHRSVSSRAFAPSSAAVAESTVLRSQPWWQRVDVLHGTGALVTAAPALAEDAIHWRLRWSCSSGRFRVTASATEKPLVDGICTGRKTTTQVVAAPSGPLSIRTDGPWRLRIEQQVDEPLHEPPLTAMNAAGGGD